MRPILFAVLMTLTVVGLTKGLCLAQSALEPADASADSQDIRPAKDPTLSQSPPGKRLIMAQNTTQKKSATNAKNQSSQTTKPKSNQIQTHTSDRRDHYQCLDYCVVVRQSCEGLATVQPDITISKIGSKQNSHWSRECQKIYKSCMNRCDSDENNVHWKRTKPHPNNKALLTA